MEITFRESTLLLLEKQFGLDALDKCPALQAWLTEDAVVSDWEREILIYLQQLLRHNVHSWNEPGAIQPVRPWQPCWWRKN